MENLIKRLLSATVLGTIVIVGIVYLPDAFLKAFIPFIAAVSAWEVFNILSKKTNQLNLYTAALVSFLSSVLVIFHLWLLATLVILLYSFFVAAKRWNLEVLTFNVFGLVYTAFLVSSLALIIDINKYLLFVLFATVWAGDTFAYIVGKMFGKHKLAPLISPNKTWEGAIGSFTASVIFGSSVAVYLNLTQYIPAIVLASIIMQIGDLFESFIKRQAGVKDSSNLIPGHGGILDRIDGLIFASATFVAYHNLVQLLIKY